MCAHSFLIPLEPWVSKRWVSKRWVSKRWVSKNRIASFQKMDKNGQRPEWLEGWPIQNPPDGINVSQLFWMLSCHLPKTRVFVHPIQTESTRPAKCSQKHEFWGRSHSYSRSTIHEPMASLLCLLKRAISKLLTAVFFISVDGGVIQLQDFVTASLPRRNIFSVASANVYFIFIFTLYFYLFY